MLFLFDLISHHRFVVEPMINKSKLNVLSRI